MTSDLDCVECGGYVSIERLKEPRLCPGCEEAQRREREGFPSSYDDDKVADDEAEQIGEALERQRQPEHQAGAED